MSPFSLSAFGTTFKSRRQAAAAFGIPESTLCNRLKNDWDIEVALIVSTDKVTFYYVGLDRQARYKTPWAEKNLDGWPNPQTAREIVEHYRPDLLDAYDKSNPTGQYHPYKKS